jgi:MFS family permease
MRYIHQMMTDIMQWNRNIRLFFLANIIYQLGSGMFAVLYNLYVQALGYDHSMTGTIISLQSLATALIFVPIGLLGDKSSRKTIMIIGAFVSGISFIGRSYVETELSMQLFALVTGLFASFFQVTAVPFLAANAGKEQRLQLFSYHFAAMLAAQVIGSMGGGSLADLLQGAGWSKITSLQTVLVVGGIATLAAFIPLLFVRESQEQEVAVQEANKPLPVENGKSEWTFIIPFTFAQLLVGLGSGLVVPYLNLYFTDRFNASLTTVGVLISLGQVMTILSMLIGPALVRRVGQVRAVVCFQLISLPFLLITGFTNVLFIASLAFLFRQALMNAANPIQSSVLVDRVSNSRRGIANSLTQTAFMLGWASMGKVQSYFITVYGTYWGYVWTFSLTGALYVAAALFYYFRFREKR